MENVTIKPISRILIANRGEIARRIISSARDMGIATVAVFADSDANAPYVKEADAAVALNGRTSAETYLDMRKVLDACKRSGADAVHPGYGFLSENAAFAQAVMDAGMAWIGPSPEAIGLMGDKLSAKRLMEKAGVPTLSAIPIDQSTDVSAAAREVGYPVLIKASAGGGGRGMRIVENDAVLAEAVASARREAAGAFGDDTVFLERWLASCRHVEIQILGDRHGNLVHCFERECSIQRRHQKIIEEAPSSAVTDVIRRKMGEAAIAAAKQLGYYSAGTVEFLLAGDEFWFLEVNTRLQVEHPVTEEVIGHDLVREQIRIAEGEPLSFSQDDLAISGHAIEARLYAEDPANGFLPSPGPVLAWMPSAVGSARFDSGIEAGSEISLEFDPMIAKVICHAPSRREAAARLARVLETTRVQGLTTNRDFLVATLRSPAFIAGDTTTDFIERVKPALRREASPEETIAACIAAIMQGQARRRAGAKVMRHVPSGWRNTYMPLECIMFTVDGHDITLQYRSRRDGKFRVLIEGDEEAERIVTPYTCGQGIVDIDIDGQRQTFMVDNHGANWLVHSNRGDLALVEQPRYPSTALSEGGAGLMAPMPGSVLATEVSAGDTVSKGQLLVILEAMKMEHRITAPRDGKVGDVHVAVGDQVANGQLLVTMADEEDT